MIGDGGLLDRLAAGSAAVVFAAFLFPDGTGGAGAGERPSPAPPGRRPPDRLSRMLGTPPPDSAEAHAALSALRRAVELTEEGRTGAAGDSVEAAGRVLAAAGDWILLGRARAAAVSGDTARVLRLLPDPDSAASPGWARSLLVTARDSAGDPAGAARAALRWADATASRGERSRALLRAGRLLAGAGRQGRSREALRRAAETARWRDPALEAARELAGRGHLAPREQLAAGRAFAAHGEWEEAASRLDAYLQATEPGAGDGTDRDSVRLEYGRALFRAGHDLRAVRVAKALRAEAPDLAPGAMLLEARARVRYGGPADGVEMLAEVARRHPDDPAAGQALADLASRAEEEGRRHDARRYWIRAARHAGSAERAELRLVRSASLAYLSGDYDSAAALFSERTGGALRPEDSQRSRYWEALSRRAAGQDERARSLLREVLREDRFSYYGTGAAELLGEPLLPADLPRGPSTPDVPGGELTNALLRLRVARVVAPEDVDAVAAEADRLDEHFRRHDRGRYALAEAMNAGGFPIRGVRLANRIRLGGEERNLRLLRDLYPFPYREDIRRVAAERGLSPFLVAGVIRQESLFQASIESEAGAIGLMQIMPATGRDLARAHGVGAFRTDDLRRASLNLRLGTGYLTDLIGRFDGNVAFALAAYNAGPHRMSRWRRRPVADDLDVFLESIPFRQTRHYVKAVQAHARIYAALYGCGDREAGRYAPCLGREASFALRPEERAGERPPGERSGAR